jgi:hypothetical protein
VDPGPQLVRNGPTIPGRVGGVTTSRIIFLSSCLPIILALPSRWKATFNFVTGGIQAAPQHALGLQWPRRSPRRRRQHDPPIFIRWPH